MASVAPATTGTPARAARRSRTKLDAAPPPTTTSSSTRWIRLSSSTTAATAAATDSTIDLATTARDASGPSPAAARTSSSIRAGARNRSSRTSNTGASGPCEASSSSSRAVVPHDAAHCSSSQKARAEPVDSEDARELERRLRPDAIADGDHASSAQALRDPLENCRAVVGLVDDDDLAFRRYRQVEDRHHARQHQHRIGIGTEEAARNPAVRVGALPEERDPALDAREVLEVGGEVKEQEVDALGAHPLREASASCGVVEHRSILRKLRRPKSAVLPSRASNRLLLDASRSAGVGRHAARGSERLASSASNRLLHAQGHRPRRHA